jgi:hypothetical protein
VLDYNPDPAVDASMQASELVGRNLYTNVPILSESKDFCDRINSFFSDAHSG